MTARNTLLILAVGAILVVLPAAGLDGLSYLLWLNEGSKGTAAANPPFVSSFVPTMRLSLPWVVGLVIATFAILFAARRSPPSER